MHRTTIALIALVVIAGAVGPAAAGSIDESEPAIADEECSYPVTETDATGAEVTVDDEPETVVTLNPSAAQTMWEIGAEEKVIGVTEHAMNLDGAEDRTNISTSEETIEPEVVIDLDPDLVLAPSSQVVSEDLVEILRDAGLTVYLHPSAESVDDVREKTHLIGELVGECEGAAETVEWMDHEIEIVESAIEGEERPDVLYTFFGHTAGDETFIHEIIEASGGTNVAAEEGLTEYPQLSEETVIDTDPDWIVLNSDSPEVPDSEAYEETTAVEQDQVVVVDINHLNRAGPRITHAITELAEAFHSDAYAEARAEGEGGDGSMEDDDSMESTDSTESDDSPDPAESGESDGLPGFGAVGALVALTIATLAVIRHRDGGS